MSLDLMYLDALQTDTTRDQSIPPPSQLTVAAEPVGQMEPAEGTS